MGIWLEIRCENLANPSSKRQPDAWEKQCFSHTNSGPMAMAGDTKTSVIQTLRTIEIAARETGWLKTKYGWICPYCAAQPSALKELASA